MTRVAIALVFAALLGGCLRETAFQCAMDVDCSGGTCEAVGFCSFVDDRCTSGRRYGDHAGSYSGRCVGDEPEIDAPGGGPDGPPGADASVDAPPAACPVDYVAIAGAPSVYRIIGNAMGWTEQQVDCTNDGGGYLMIPDDGAELAAVTGAAGAPIWVGISDTATEGEYRTVRGDVATFLPWAATEPDGDVNPQQDCVLGTGGTISDERCGNLNAIAVCECVPP
jgi:hypothetical protein